MLTEEGITIAESFQRHRRIRGSVWLPRHVISIQAEAMHLAGVGDHLYPFPQVAQFRHQDLSVELIERRSIVALDNQNRTLNSGKLVAQDFPILVGIESPRIFHYGTSISRIVSLSLFR